MWKVLGGVAMVAAIRYLAARLYVLMNTLILVILGDEEKVKTRTEVKEEHKFTDDTAMARSVAKSLIEKNGLDVKDLAQR